MKERGKLRFSVVVFLGVLFFFFLTIGLRTFTRQILVKRLGITNGFTQLVLFDQERLNQAETGDDEGSSNPGEIDWEELYPFADGVRRNVAEEKPVSLPQRLKAKVAGLEKAVDTYTSKFLVGYDAMTAAANRCERIAQWNYVPLSEYNGIIKMRDGFLTGLCAEADTAPLAASTAELAAYCRERGSEFLYVMAPYKICQYDDTDLSGVTDFSNQNGDAFLSQLAAAGVDALDLRETLHSEGLNHHALFYRTDHHWRAETGLWASRHLLELMRDRYGFDVDPAVLDEDRFTRVDYPAWFLGSQGKKVTLAQTEPDDFTLLYPDYQTRLHYEIPSLHLDETGDFSVFYDMDQVDILDYSLNPYGAHIYGDRPVETIENLRLKENGRLLIVHDSFGDCVVPFLAMGLRNVDSVDVRHFTGSLRSYLDQTKPDMVMVLYNNGELNASLTGRTNEVFFFQ